MFAQNKGSSARHLGLDIVDWSLLLLALALTALAVVLA